MNIREPLEVQRLSLPDTLAGRDVKISAQTGSGKTFAYLLPIFQRLLDEPATAITGSRALILLPTRELADQVFKLARNLGDHLLLKTILITGGQESNYQAAKLRKDPDIIIATPGRMIQHLESTAAVFSDIRIAILDEADRMLDMGFRDEVLTIFDYVPAERQTLLLSATLNHRGIKTISETLLSDPQELTLSVAQDAHQNLTHQIVLSDEFDHKIKQVEKLLESTTSDKVLIFANKITTVERITEALQGKCVVACLHGDMRQDERKFIAGKFRHRDIQVLVATDLAARGLDIATLALVINFDVPHSGDEYVHRAGRTGRGEAEGLVISLVASHDFRLIQGIQRYLKQSFAVIKVPGLEAKFKGVIKRTKKKANKASGKPKAKVRARDKKAKGKRRAPKKSPANSNGMAPPKRPL